MNVIEELETRLDVLLRKFVALESDNARLRDIVARQQADLSRMTDKLNGLEQSMVSVDLSRTSASEEEIENMRRQLDTVISEIDRILRVMND